MAVKINIKNCTGCGACVDACPINAIHVENKKAVVNDNCVECGACISQCPHEAISL